MTNDPNGGKAHPVFGGFMPGPLHKMFSTVPPKYDLVNRVATLGLDQSWRRKAVDRCLEDSPATVLDLCCGTGDMTVMLGRRAGPGATVIGGDFVEPMLEEARKKALRARGVDELEFVRVDAAALPFEDASLDAVTISFGFRNLTYKNSRREDHLREIRRVIAPGGRLVVVESSRPPGKAMGGLFKFFMKGFVAPLGGLLSGQRSAYKYLSSSVLDFYTAGEVCDMLVECGFAKARYDLFFGGVAAVHVATV